jgi:hypothetical protein
MGMPAMWLEYPTYNATIKQGGSEQVRYWVNAADGTHPYETANYYIDGKTAGGRWDVTPPNPGGCQPGLAGGAGGLYLNPEDTMKLSPGWHTLTIDFLGNDTYAPSQFTAQFLVVAAG